MLQLQEKSKDNIAQSRAVEVIKATNEFESGIRRSKGEFCRSIYVDFLGYIAERNLLAAYLLQKKSNR